MNTRMHADTAVEPVLRMTGITKEFSGIRVLHGVEFDVRHGEVMALMGENGAGKSTLMKVLAGVYSDWEGSVSIGGRDVRPASIAAAEKAGVSIIYQELSLIPELTVAENIFLGREPLRFGGVIDYTRMNDMARSILDDLHFSLPTTAPVSSLTIGHQQLVEIAKALSLNARILIMDEPTSALSEQETVVLFTVVRKLRERGVSIIYISHRIGEVFDIADRVTVMRDGHIVDVRRTGEVSRDDLIRLMVGRDIDTFFVPKEKPGDDIVLRVSGLSRTGGNREGKPQVRDVSFEVRRGENLGMRDCWALAEPNCSKPCSASMWLILRVPSNSKEPGVISEPLSKPSNPASPLSPRIAKATASCLA